MNPGALMLILRGAKQLLLYYCESTSSCDVPKVPNLAAFCVHF